MNSNDISRRAMLGASGAALLAGGSAGVTKAFATTVPGKARISKGASAERVIFFWLGGGMSHLDTWDPKPGRPSQGEFAPIATSAPGVSISEIFPRLATQMHHCTLVRSLVGQYDQHLPATTHLQTGRELGTDAMHPGLGSLCVRGLGSATQSPAYVAISGRAPSPGWLGRRYAGEFVPSPEDALNSETLHRQSSPPPSRERVRVGGQATSDVPFSQINAKDFHRYGDTTFGRGALLARLLIERGTRFVHVYRGGFDTHANGFHTLRMHGDVMDQPLAVLIEDLAQSGMLATTLVVVLSEFGRSPRVNSYVGRDHWSECFSCLLAGGGFAGGTVIGASDRDGYRPASNPMQVSDLHAAIYRALGISSSTDAPPQLA